MKASTKIMLLITLGCTYAYSPLFAQAIGIKHISNAHPDDLAVSIDATGTVVGPNDNKFNGMTVKYNADGSNGAGWFATQDFPPDVDSGWNAGPADGVGFAPITASDFKIAGGSRMQREVEPIDEANSAYYLDRFRQIETLAYRYEFESDEMVPDMHLGVVIPSLPEEILTVSNSRADGLGEPKMAVSLTDWLGLVTVVLQDTDRRLTAMQRTLAAVDQRNLELQRENDLLRTRVASLTEGTSPVTRPAP